MAVILMTVIFAALHKKKMLVADSFGLALCSVAGDSRTSLS